MIGGGGFAKCLLLHKPYLIEWSTKGDGVKIYSKNCPHGLRMTTVRIIVRVNGMGREHWANMGLIFPI